MPQCSKTHFLTHLVQHATLSESGPIRACYYIHGTLETPIPGTRAVLIDSGMPI